MVLIKYVQYSKVRIYENNRTTRIRKPCTFSYGRRRQCLYMWKAECEIYVKIVNVHEDKQINMLKRVNALHHQRSKQSNGYSLHRHAMDDEFVSNGWNVSLQANTIGDNDASSGSDVQMNRVSTSPIKTYLAENIPAYTARQARVICNRTRN